MRTTDVPHWVPSWPYGNCFLWALRCWVQFGGAVAMRRSHHLPFPHFAWGPDGSRWYSYAPVTPRHGWLAWLHMLWFRGYVRLETGQDFDLHYKGPEL